MSNETERPAPETYTTGGTWSFFAWVFLIGSIVSIVAALSMETTVTVSLPDAALNELGVPGITIPQAVANNSLMQEQMVKFIAGAALLICSILCFGFASIKAAIVDNRDGQ